MRVLRAARLFALKWVWLATGLQTAGRALVRALSSPDEGVRTIAGMFLVQAGARAVPLVEEALGQRQGLPMVLLVAGDIGASRLEPELRRFTTDPDPQVAKAALDSLRTLAAQHTSVP
jgi:HEAT repeat protein